MSGLSIFYLILAITLVGGGIVFVKTSLAPFLYWLADFDAIWNPIRRLPPEGEMFIVLKGGVDGPFAKVLESVPEFDFDLETNCYIQFDPASGITKKEGFLKQNGMGYTGFNRRLLMRDVVYDKWEKLPNSSAMGMVTKARHGPSMYFQYLMATRVLAAETSANFPVNATITFTVRIINPVKALFFAGGWNTQAVAAVQGAVREYIANKTPDDLRKERAEDVAVSTKSPMIDRILAINLKDFGLEIVNAIFVDFDLVTGGPNDQAMADALRAVEIAEKQGEAQVMAATKAGNATIEKARKDAEALGIKSKGEMDAAKNRATAIKAEYEARRDGGGNHAGTFAISEAIKEAKPQVLGGEFLSSVLTPPKK